MSLNIQTKIKTYLSTNHMFVDEEWLAGFAEYLFENDSGYTDDELQRLSKEQWLLNDLKDICPGSLPPNLKSQRKTLLKEKFVLQINAVIDIGTPAYQQYLKIQKVNVENVEATVKFEDKVPSHRMIKLYLSDGVQEVTGIEYKPMRNLSCDITPGCKVLIKGPVECRRGMLLLTESAVELLGGEVQEIVESNCLAALLSKKLRLPLTNAQTQHDNTNQTRHLNIPKPDAQMPPDIEPPEQQHRPVARVTSVQVADNFTDDIDFDELAAIEAQISTHKRTSNAASKPEKRMKMDPVSVNRTDYEDCIAEDDWKLEERFLENEDDANVNSNMGPIVLSSKPFVYIKQINDMSESDKAGRVFRVKGQIMKLLSKLTVGKEGWSLKCTIIDGTGCLDVDFTGDVLSKLVGSTPQEMNQLKKDIATKPELKQQVVLALQRAKEHLQVLYCIIELTILESPKITALIPYDNTHLELLKERQPCLQY